MKSCMIGYRGRRGAFRRRRRGEKGILGNVEINERIGEGRYARYGRGRGIGLASVNPVLARDESLLIYSSSYVYISTFTRVTRRNHHR